MSGFSRNPSSDLEGSLQSPWIQLVESAEDRFFVERCVLLGGGLLYAQNAVKAILSSKLA